MPNNILNSSRSLLPPSLTSYDFLKFAALALMIVDHIGYYLAPDELWIRAIGRLSAPIWLFLIGYAKSRDLSWPIWAGMIILVVSNYVVGAGVLPVNILGTIIVFRLLIDPLMVGIARNPKSLYPVTTLLFLISIPTAAAVEYGTSAMLLVMIGYMTRNRESLPFDKSQFVQFVAIAATLYALLQAFAFFYFDVPQMAFVVLGVFGVMLFLTSFRPVEYPDLTRKIPSPFVWLIKLCGRHSLAIYVVHVLILKFTALALGYKGYELFHFHIL